MFILTLAIEINNNKIEYVKRTCNTEAHNHELTT